MTLNTQEINTQDISTPDVPPTTISGGAVSPKPTQDVPPTTLQEASVPQESTQHSHAQDADQHVAGNINNTTDKTVLVAVMGITGAGKSFFINKMTGDSEVEVGDSLTSCTHEIDTFFVTIGGIQYGLIDTPGFNDTDYEGRSDVDALADLSVWLDQTYRQNIKLSGIIYLHPLTHNRMEGASLKSLKMFRKLCGDDNLGNVFLTTTHWGKVENEEGERYEKQLQEEFWKPFIENGAKVKRFQGDRDSGASLLQSFSDAKQMTLEIQRETVEQNKSIADTAAGQVMNGELIALKAQYEKQIESTRQEISEMKGESEAERKEMAEELNKLQGKLDKNEQEKTQLHLDRSEENRRLQEQIEEKSKSNGWVDAVTAVGTGLAAAVTGPVGAAVVHGIESLIRSNKDTDEKPHPAISDQPATSSVAAITGNDPLLLPNNERKQVLERAKGQKTPAGSPAVKATDHTYHYNYGTTDTVDIPESIRSEVKVQEGMRFKQDRKENSSWGTTSRIEAGLCIIGFRVESSGSSTNGQFTITSGGVGYDHVEVRFQGEPSQSVDWKLYAWSVNGPEWS